MKKIISIFIIAIFAFAGVTQAQNAKTETWDIEEGALVDGKTIIKTNILGWGLRSFDVTGERIINKNISVMFGVGFIPKGNIPFINSLTDDEASRAIQISSLSMTPEVRFYLGSKGYGRGFYVAPYYRYQHLGADNFNVSFVDDHNKSQSVSLNGGLNTHSFGLNLGIQWLLGAKKNFVLDWTILGAHYGVNNTKLNGTSTNDLSANEQATLKKNIESDWQELKLGDVEILKLKEVNVSKNAANVSANGPWAFFRMGLSIGYRF